MAFKLIADTFSVARDSDHFVQLKSIKKPRSTDQVWLALEVVGDTKYARSTMQNIVETIDEVFFDQTDGLTAYERFEMALKEVNILIKGLRAKRKKSFGEINGIIAVFSGAELHITQSNNAEAYLIRQNKFSMISEGLSSKSEDLFVNIASGQLTSDDKLIFTTARLLRLATHSQIVQLFNDGVAEAVENVKELTMANEELSLGVVCLHTKLSQKAGAKTEKAGRGGAIAEKVKGAASTALRFVSEKTNRTPSGPVNRKKVLLAIGAVLVVLVISVSVLMESRRNRAIRAEFRTQIESLNEQLQVANTKGYANDKETANNILSQVEAEAREVLESNYFRAEAMALLDKVQATRDSINNTDRLKDLAPFADLSEKSAEGKALGLVNLDDKFFIYEFNKLYEMILDQVLDPRTIDDTEVAIASTAMQDQDVLVFLTQSGRVMEYVDGLFRFANTEDESWKSGVDVAAYGRYIYILNPDDNQIYKYARLRNTYSNGGAYNNDADLEGAKALTIDGNIYVLKDGGRIVKIFKSKQQPFQVEDLAVDISEATDIFTGQELDNLYILDPVNKRVVIIDKQKARYFGQIIFEDLENINSIYVEENENKLYLLTDREVYQINI